MDHRGLFARLTFLTLLTYGLFTQVETLVNCQTSYKNHQHCEFQPGGVRNLDCFSRLRVMGIKTWRCEWQPGIGSSKNTYSLYNVQPGNCYTASNITGLNHKIGVIEKEHMTALVVENPDFKNCTKAFFKGTPKDLFRCGPPLWSLFYRHSGILDVSVGWLRQEKKYIRGYEMRYKAMGDLQWKLSKIHENGSLLDNLNTSQVYVAQVKCANNTDCSQCPWSDPHIIPPELKMQPILINLEGVDSPITTGSRLVYFTWKTTGKERPDGYSVSIQKASGEPPKDHFNTTQTEMTLNLSCSAYILTISAFNNASVSPALSQTIPSCEHVTGMDAGKLNVTLHSNTSVTVHWEALLLKRYVCYSVELRRKQHKTTYFSFYENVQSYKTLHLNEPLEPYKRYTLSLHTRPNKDTCNLKSINSSECTYGNMHFYFMEESPMSAPSNISFYNVTSTSLVLQWSPIPEDDLRGFLLGYNISYKEYNWGTHTAEKTVTVDAELTSYKIEGLKPGTRYELLISGYTWAGTGVWSIPGFFKTYEQDYDKDSVTIVVLMATIALLIVACPLLKRTKVIIWPSIPNPKNSNALQKIEKFCEMELQESLQTLKMEEWDTYSLHIIKKAADNLSLPIIFASENQESSPEKCSEQFQQDTISDNIEDIKVHTDLTGRVNNQPAVTCGYTTLETFQNAVKHQGSPSTSNEARGGLLDDNAVLKPGLDYIRQLCSSHTFDMSTKL